MIDTSRCGTWFFAPLQCSLWYLLFAILIPSRYYRFKTVLFYVRIPVCMDPIYAAGRATTLNGAGSSGRRLWFCKKYFVMLLANLRGACVHEEICGGHGCGDFAGPNYQTLPCMKAICHYSRNDLKRKVLRHANPSDARQSTQD